MQNVGIINVFVLCLILKSVAVNDEIKENDKNTI